VRIAVRSEAARLSGLAAAGVAGGYALVRLFVVGTVLVVLLWALGAAARRVTGLAVVAAGTALGGLVTLAPTLLTSPACPAVASGTCHDSSTEVLAATLAAVLLMSAAWLAAGRLRRRRG